LRQENCTKQQRLNMGHVKEITLGCSALSRGLIKMGVLLSLFLSCLYLPGQPWPLPREHYSVNDGLSDRLIKAIVQTEEGLLWLGTANGLNRFDGYEFLVFDNHPGNELNISGANISKLQLEKNGHIVITYKSNSILFDILIPETMEVRPVSLLPEFGIEGLPRLVTVNAHGEILVVSIDSKHTNIYRYIQGNQFEKLVSIPEQHRVKSVTVHLIQLDAQRFMLNDSEKGLRIYDAKNKSLQVFERTDIEGMDNSAPYPGTAYFLHQDRSGKVWFSLQGYKGAYYYQPGHPGLHSLRQLPQQAYYTSIWEDEAGNVLLSSTAAARDLFPTEGLHCLRPDGKATDFSYFLDLSRYIVSVFSKDFFQTVFLGIDTGLKIVQNQQPKVVKYLAKNLSADRRGAVMRGMATDGERFMYIAREVGPWYELDLQTGFLDTLHFIDERSGRKVEMSCTGNLQMDKQGNLWGISCLGAASQGGRLHRYNIHTCKLQTYEFEHRFSSFTLSQDGLIWLCAEPTDARGALVAFNPKTERFEAFTDKEGQNPLRNANPYFIFEARDEMLWIGTENGLYKINRKTRLPKVYQAYNGSSGLSSNIIYAIHEDQNGHLWLGTTNGLNILDPTPGTFKHFSRADGLASNTVCGILPDEHGNYWISTYNGLSYYDRKAELFRNFYTTDGLSHDEFNRFSYLRGPDGRFYFGGVNGINIFRGKDLLINAKAPPVVLTKISIYNSRLNQTFVQNANLTGLEKLIISPHDSYFTIHFTLPKYKNIRRNRYQAILEGYDKEWASTGNSLRLNKLPPGEYTLRVKATDANGNQSSKELTIPILVKPAFYQTAWFKLLSIIAILLIVFAIFRYRLKRHLDMERIRTKLSSDLHDEVSGLLSNIALQTDILQSSAQDAQSKERLKYIGEVSRKAMSKMSDVIWSIDSRRDRVEDLLHRMQEHADEVLRPLDITLEMHIGKLDRQRKIPVVLRQNLYFIFKEAVNNIAKHSSASRAIVKFYHEGSEFFLLIQDNGKTAHQTEEKQSNKNGQGLDNMRLRAERIGAELGILPHDNGFQVAIRGKRFC
jgi:ligand-binding sensor domain-containing protein/two-component sensor histidine kinase